VCHARQGHTGPRARGRRAAAADSRDAGSGYRRNRSRAEAGAGGSAVVVPPAPQALRFGTGSIDSITPVPNSSNKRVGVRMADNSIQYLDTSAAGISVGDRVEITTDGYMKRPAP
jgi:hypothetical protein